ncbi:MAG: hypothetical protein E7158_05800 [Firmicutes bacterium]|nr:hypothetical protein [Bacillota bacterium]
MKKILGKIKKSWNENRVLFMLTIVLIICTVLILGVVVDYFLGTTKDKYGDRLEGIKKVEIKDSKIKEIEKKVSEDEKIEKCKINQIGKVIYMDITFTDGISLVEAEGKVQGTLENFSDQELKFYDINYTLIQPKKEGTEGFTIMGSKNANGSGIVWNNNNPYTPEEEE